jgi:predicted DNA-binding protein YlxM (UPF0122 family)
MDRQNFEMLNFFIKNDALTLGEIQTRFNTSRVTIAKTFVRLIKNLRESPELTLINQNFI